MRLDDPPAVRFKVFIGLLIGVAVASVVYFGFWGGVNLTVVMLLIVGKIVAALVTARIPGWRPVAEGLLVSIGLAALLFIGKCASDMSG